MDGDMKNCSMKNSFSLSSLPPSSPCLETPEHVRLRERPYNSLTKNPRKSEEKESWRKSWDSQSGKIGEKFEENYNYLMGTCLIDSCRNVADEDQRKNYHRKILNQSIHLVQYVPEISLNLDNNSLKTVNLLECLNRRQPKQHFYGNCLDLFLNIEHEIRALTYCIDCIETKLPPVGFSTKFKKEELTKEELGRRKCKHEGIHQELEAVGRQIRAKKFVIENVSFTNNITTSRSKKLHSLNPSYKSIRLLGERWQRLYIRSIEWDVTIDNLLNSSCRRQKIIYRSESSSSSDNNDEPVSKIRRLSNNNIPNNFRYVNNSENSIGSEHLLMDTSVPTEDTRPTQSVDPSNVYLSDYSPKMIDSPHPDQDNNSHLKVNQTAGELHQFSFDDNLFMKDSSIFNNSDRSAPNHAIIYLKHEDTDSEDRKHRIILENGFKNSENELKTSDLSSEDEETASWAYDSGTRTVSDGNEAYKTSSGSCTESYEKSFLKSECNPRSPTIKKLVNDAEFLISPTRKKSLVSNDIPHHNAKRIKHKNRVYSHEVACDGLKFESEEYNVADSCDASGEYTTDDDELPCSYVSENNLRKPDDLDNTFTEQSKIDIRKKLNRHSERPRSMSVFPNQSNRQMLNHNFSNSESALSQMHNSSVISIKTESSMNSSSTIEESSQNNDMHIFSNSDTLRKHKRTKSRRMIGRKNGAGSADNLSKCNKCLNNKTFTVSPQLYKSESFSGSFSRRLSFSADQGIISDTTNVEMEDVVSSSSDVCGNTLQEDLSEDKKKPEEKKKMVKKKLLQVPNFKIGKDTNFFSSIKLRTDFTTSGAEEQTSSVGTIPDEAWDNYQEKYHSEAYSEDLPDSELLSKTLHFGEDYGSFIDSQSDCSSISAILRPKNGADSPIIDSESEEDVEKFITKSKLNFVEYETHLHSSHANRNNLIRECRDYIRRLRILAENLEDFDISEIKELTAKYENLETKLSEDNIVRELTEEMGLVRKELIDLNRRITDIEKHKVSEHNELNEKIREIQEKKDKLSQVTQTFIISRSDSLTDEQNTLYKQCVMAQNKLEEKHDFLLKISDTWQQLESDLMKFQSDLRSEVEKLTKELGKPGDLIQELMLQKFSSIQDPAVFQDEFCKVFSERDTNLSNQSFQMYQATTMPSCEGSDSGISDSEHDCERDRKLTDLRRQQKDLESILTASRKTLLAEKIDETEQQLRNLRNLQKARRLLFHSTLLPAAGAMTSNGNDIAPWNVIRNRKNRNQSLESTSMPSHSTKDDESDPEPHKSNSRLWRIVRAALPFHLAIIVFVCIAWLLDPRCCDQINNLNLSSSPQLKYFSGPPPT